MSGKVIGHELSIPQRKELAEDLTLEGLPLEIQRRLVIIAPSQRIWEEYARSFNFPTHNQFGEYTAVNRGSQLITQRFIAPIILVVGLPYDLELRLAVQGALLEMTESWESQGGRVIYIEGFTPSAEAAREARLANRDVTRERGRQEIAAADRRQGW